MCLHCVRLYRGLISTCLLLVWEGSVWLWKCVPGQQLYLPVTLWFYLFPHNHHTEAFLLKPSDRGMELVWMSQGLKSLWRYLCRVYVCVQNYNLRYCLPGRQAGKFCLLDTGWVEREAIMCCGTEISRYGPKSGWHVWLGCFSWYLSLTCIEAWFTFDMYWHRTYNTFIEATPSCGGVWQNSVFHRAFVVQWLQMNSELRS